MKKLIAILLVLTMSIGLLTACGGDDKKSTTGDSGSSSEGKTPASTNIVDTSGDITYSIADKSTASAIDLGGLYTSDSMLDKAIQTKGNAQRFASAFERASQGEKITVAFVGAELTKGEGASAPEKSYAALVEKWLKETFPKANIMTINMGVRNANSCMALGLANAEIVPNHPDIVIVDTAMYDGASTDQEYLECLLRDLLSCASEPAVMVLANCTSTYGSDSANHASMCFKYNIPFINYASVLENNIKNGTWKWTDISTANETRLQRDTGHAFAAYLVTGYFKRVIDGISASKYARYTMPDNTTTKCRFSGSKFVDINACSPKSDNSKFSIQILKNNTDEYFKKGLETKESDVCTVKLNAKSIAAVIYQSSDGEFGTYDISADGEVKVSVSSGIGTSDENSTYSQMDTAALVQGTEAKDHTIKFSINADKSKADDGSTYQQFVIAGFIYN